MFNFLCKVKNFKNRPTSDYQDPLNKGPRSSGGGILAWAMSLTQERIHTDAAVEVFSACIFWTWMCFCAIIEAVLFVRAFDMFKVLA